MQMMLRSFPLNSWMGTLKKIWINPKLNLWHLSLKLVPVVILYDAAPEKQVSFFSGFLFPIP
jgi:hypothetical protein